MITAGFMFVIDHADRFIRLLFLSRLASWRLCLRNFGIDILRYKAFWTFNQSFSNFYIISLYDSQSNIYGIN